MFAVRVGHTFADAQRAYKDEIEKWRAAIEKVADLFIARSPRIRLKLPPRFTLRPVN